MEVTSKERTSLSNDIDPPVNIMLEPKQETTDFMLAETYKLLILRIMTTKVKIFTHLFMSKAINQDFKKKIQDV